MVVLMESPRHGGFSEPLGANPSTIASSACELIAIEHNSLEEVARSEEADFLVELLMRLNVLL